MPDTEALARDLVGGAGDLINRILIKHSKGVIEGIRDLVEEAKKNRRERDTARQCVATIVTALKAGEPPEDILVWWEEEGRHMVNSDPAPTGG